MKKLFSFAIACMAAATMVAQNQLATLNHKGEIKTFYGINAFKESMKECDNGDIVTLSPGRFNSANIKKCITLRGAGLKENSEEANPHGATYIDGDLYIYAKNDDSLTSRMYIEGIYFSDVMYNQGLLIKPTFEKCCLKFHDYNSDYHIKNALFLHCRLYGPTIDDGSSLNCINCIIAYPDTPVYGSNKPTEMPLNCVNCHIITYSTNRYQYCNFSNCTIYKGGSKILSEYASATNCVCVNDSNFFYSLINSSTDIAGNSLNIFKGNDGSIYNIYQMFELSDNAKTEYLSNDGTEVGIHGGAMPFDEDPIAPKIVKCNVANKSTADGKLSVEIEVKSAE